MLGRLIVLFCLAGALVAADLPVKKVVLYKHGVGYFERAGEIEPGGSARLDFKASEMNDVLKSLTLSASGKGGVTALRYDASEPIARKLAVYPFNLGQGQGLSGLIDQLKGEEIELRFGDRRSAGKIIGARFRAATRDQPEREQVTLLASSGELVTLDLGAASSIRFPDPKLQKQFTDYLAVLAGARSRDKRSVYVDASGNGRRAIRASYMIPTPIWKSSYRLIFPESGRPVIEGWAIVDNTTGDDWDGVDLALVSGRPISFVSRLYEPTYVKRPVAELAENRPVAPVVHAGAMGMVEEKALRDEARGRRMQGKKVVAGIPSIAMAKVPGVGGAFAPSSVAATSEGRELGELFEYRFSGPVTVKRNESAMLPFLQQAIDARKLLIYTDQGAGHPMNAAELTNSMEKTLDGGPVTVFDAGAYAGEALMETLKAGDKRLISYGVDLGTRITTKFDSSEAVVEEIHVRRGVLTAKSSVRETKTYTIKNVDAKPKTLIIEHPARTGYKLVNRKPSERTGDAYRFEVALKASAGEKLAVTEERVLTNTFGLANLSPDVLVSYTRNKELSATAREQLEQVAQRQRGIAGTDREMQRLDAEMRGLTQDQDRIRKNISSLNRVSGQQEQVQKYAAELAARESRLAEVRDELSNLRRKRATLQQELNDLIEKMEF